MIGTRRQSVCFGLCASALLHALLVAPLVLGTQARKEQSQEPLGSSSGASAAMHDTVLVSIADDSASSNGTSFSPPSLAIDGEAIARRLMQSGTPKIAFDDQAATREAQLQAEGPPSELYGRYLGQVKARVDRAWIKPRTAIGASLFSCRARIAQDEQGAVQAIELEGCNGDTRWQASLLHAIERASPLSAPPDPSVFQPTLVLDFLSTPYVQGSSEDNEFEPQRAANPARVAAQTPPQEKAGANSPDKTGHYELRVVHSTTTWTRTDAPQ